MDVETKNLLLKLLEGQAKIDARISELEVQVKKNSVKIESLVNNASKDVSNRFKIYTL